MSDDLEVFHSLQRHSVPFIIIGGHAVNLHGYLRTTEDADVIWLRSPENEVQLLAALTEIGARYLGKQIDPETGLEREYPVTAGHIQANHLMMLWTRFGFLDLFDYVPAYPETDVGELLATSVEHDGLRFVSRDWLMKLKRGSGRPKDLLDLENLPD